MNISVRTLKSQAAISLAVDPSESLSDFKKRCASDLPYFGNCKFMLRGQSVPRKSTFVSLDMEPHDFLVAIPIAGKTTNTLGTAASRNTSTITVPAFAVAANQPASSSITPASAHITQQQQSTQPTHAPVTLPPAPYTLLPGYVSRPHTLDPIHPLPSEPLAGAESLQSTGPSLGAWAPQHAPLPSAALQVPHASANEPSLSDLWTDLAAELRTAPISALAQPSQAPSATHSKDSQDVTTKAGSCTQQDPAVPRVPAQQAESTVADDTAGDVTSDHPIAAKAKPKRKACRKVILADQISSPTDEPLPTAELDTLHTHIPTRASKGKARGRAAASALKAAPQAAHTTDASDLEQEHEPASRADPSRQAKNAAFKGSGALGLSRRLSSRLLTPQEVNVMARLPLPPALQRLEEVLFPPVNGMYGFLLRQHIQPTWQAIKSAARNVPGGKEVQVEDVQTMADLCPDVVILRDPHQIQSPNKSIRQWRRAGQVEAAPPSLVNPIDAEDAMGAGHSGAGPGEGGAPPTSGAHPMEIATDGAGTVFGGQARQERLVVEIMDPGRKTIGSTSLAEMGVNEDAAIQEVGMNARSLAARLPSRKHGGAAGQSEGRKGQTDRGAKNAQQRRMRAFRQSLVRAVVPSHQAFLDGLNQQPEKQQQQPPQLQQRHQQQQTQTAQPLSTVRRSPRTLRQTGKASDAEPGKASDAESTGPSQGLLGQSQLAGASQPAALASSALHTEVHTNLHVQGRSQSAGTASQPAAPASSALHTESQMDMDLASATEPSAGALQLNWDVMARKAWHPLFRVEELSLETIKCNLVAARAAEASKERHATGHSFDDGVGGKPPPRPPQMAKKHEPCLDTTPMCTNDFLKHIRQLGWYADQIVHMEDLPARQPQYALPSHPLSGPVQAALAARGINRMFTHQAMAVDAVLAGKNVVVSTSTASGKSLCYNIPILEALVQDRRACALYMFPTKALAQDQLRALRQMCAAAFGDDSPHVEVYDGDTIRAERGEARDRAQLLITNPDMLHRSILPVHSQFSRILAHLKYIVVDEGHAYKGVFGCHTAFVLRRLRRLCERFYNARPTFVVTSATVANPKEHVQELLGVEQVEVISEDGSPHGPKCFVLWNPPLTVSQQAINKGSKMKMSRTEGRARMTKGGISKRAKQEYVREELRDANQARGRGSQMGGPAGGLASVNDTEWLSEVRAGRKKAAVLRDAEKVFQAVESSQHASGSHPPPSHAQHAPRPQGGASTSAAQPTDVASPSSAAGVNPEPDAESLPLAAVEADAAPAGEAEADPGFLTTANLMPMADTNPPQRLEGNHAQGIGSSSGKALPCTQGTATTDSNKDAVVVRRAGSTAAAVKRELEQQVVPAAKRHKAVSKESQAAMAAIMATARLPTQAPSLTASNIKYLHSEQPQNRPIIRRQLPSLTALPQNIFKPGTTAGSNPHMSGLAQGAFGGSGRRQREAAGSTDEAAKQPDLPQSSEGLQLTRADQCMDPYEDGLEAEEERDRVIQGGMPGGEEWKARIGAAGTPLEQQRVSPIVELSMLLAECIQHGLRTLAFCKTRKLCELVTAYTRETLKNTAPHLAKAISVYRAGYSPQERREIEAALHDGDLWAVAATNALELGVDVGSLDVTMHLGFPGSVASLWQQAGRAGRREQPSTSIYIAFDGPLDQFFMKQPDKLFGRAIECAQVDANNPQLLEQHVCCACAEMPVTEEEDGCYFGPGLSAAMDSLLAQSLVSRHPHTTNVRALFYSGVLDTPAAAISLRAIDPERYAIVNEEDGDVIEEIEESKAFYEVYDGAVYMFQGRTYLCKKLDMGSKVAMVRAADLKYYTKTRDFTDVHVVGGRSAYPTRVGNDRYPSTAACCDSAIVTVRWLGFHRIWQGSGEVFDSIDLFLPDVQFGTQAAYIRVPRAARQRVKEAGLPFRDGLHAASHALLNVVPLYMMCNATDMAAECDNPYDTRFRPERLLLYDKHPGGIGIAAQATPLFSVLLEKALQLIQSCDCKPASGCPGCVQHTDCGEYNAVLNKFSAIIVLQCTIEAEVEHRERLRLQLGTKL